MSSLLMALLVLQDAKDLNEAVRKRLAEGADIALKDRPLPDAAAELERALGIRVVVDAAGVMRMKNKIVSFTLKKGEPAGDAITEGLKDKKLAWTVWEGLLLITSPKLKAEFDGGQAAFRPSDEELKKDEDLWAALTSDLELSSTETLGAAMKKIYAALGVKEKGSWWSSRGKEPLGWTAKRSVLRHLRVICRTTIATFTLKPGEIWFTSDKVLLGPIFADVALITTVDNARTAAYNDNAKLYATLMKELKKTPETSREIIQEKLDAGTDDEKGTKILKKMLAELK